MPLRQLGGKAFKVTILIGYEKVNERLYNSASSLIASGCKVQTFLWNRGVLREKQRTKDEERALNCIYIGFGKGVGPIRLLYSYWVFCRHVYAFLLKKPCDVIHAAHLILLPLAILLRWKTNCKVIYDAYEFHSQSISERLGWMLPGALAEKIVYGIEGFLVRRVDGVLTIDSRESFLEKFYRSKNKNVAVVYNVPPLSLEADGTEIDRIVARYADKIVLLYVGGLTKAKGCFTMLDVLAEVRKKYPAVILVCVGAFRDGSEDKFWAKVGQLNLIRNVEIIPWMPFRQMIAYFHATKIGLALYSETARFKLLGGGNGRKLFMYMFYGVPVLVPSYGDVGRIVSEEGAGISVDTKMHKEMSRAVVRLIEDSDMYGNMKEAGKRCIKNKYNWEGEQSKLIRFIDEVMR